MLNNKLSRGIGGMGRYILIIWLVTLFYQPGIYHIIEFVAPRSEWYWYSIISYYYNHVSLALLLVILIKIKKIDWRSMFGRCEVADLPHAFKLTAFIFVFAKACPYSTGHINIVQNS